MQGGVAVENLLNPPDVLFIPEHTMPLLRRRNLRTVVTIHDLGAKFLPQYHQFPQKYYLNFATEYAAVHATKLIAVSKATKEDLVKKLHVKPERITVIYEGFNETLFKSVDTVNLKKVLQVYQLEEQNYFIFLGTIQPRKNLQKLIKAFSKLTSKNSQLIIVGNKGWLSNEIYNAPREFGVEKQVKFLGYVKDKDLPYLYKGAIAFVYPSLFEGFGLPILEAQAVGCPVLTSNVSSMPEVAGEAAIFIDPYSVESITTGLEKISKPGTRENLSTLGKENVKRFSWEKSAKKTLSVIEEASL